MNLASIKKGLSSLTSSEISDLQETLDRLSTTNSDIPKSQESRRYLLNNKLGCCPHCGHKKYVKRDMDGRIAKKG